MQAEAVPQASGVEKAAVPQGTAFVLDAQDARLLTEIGMLAAEAGDVTRADAIFGALRRVRPDRAYPYIGLALARLAAGRAGEAVRLLEDADASDPQERGVLHAWRGLALQLTGRTAESRKVLNEAAAMSGEGARMALRLLGREEEEARMPARLETIVINQ